jgi:hypothetical protein
MDSINSHSLFLARCPIAWQYFAASCYWKFPMKHSWSEARKQCARLQADLVVIDSDNEFDYIAKNISDIREDFYVGFQYHNGRLNLSDGEFQYKKVNIRFLVVDKWSSFIGIYILYRR